MEEDDKDVHAAIYTMKYRAIDLSTAERSSVWFGCISQSSDDEKGFFFLVVGNKKKKRFCVDTFFT